MSKTDNDQKENASQNFPDKKKNNLFININVVNE